MSKRLCNCAYDSALLPSYLRFFSANRFPLPEIKDRYYSSKDFNQQSSNTTGNTFSHVFEMKVVAYRRIERSAHKVQHSTAHRGQGLASTAEQQKKTDSRWNDPSSYNRLLFTLRHRTHQSCLCHAYQNLEKKMKRDKMTTKSNKINSDETRTIGWISHWSIWKNVMSLR